MYQKEDVRKFLDEKQISYEWFDHKAVFTIDEMLEIGLEKEEDIAKNLFLRDNKGKRHFLVVIREDKQADLKSLGEKIGAGRLSFASEERLMKYLGLTKGSVTPFPYNVREKTAFSGNLPLRNKSYCGILNPNADNFCCAQNNNIERKFHGKTKNNRPACGSGAGAANGIYPRDSSGKRQIFCGNRQTQKVL